MGILRNGELLMLRTRKKMYKSLNIIIINFVLLLLFASFSNTINAELLDYEQWGLNSTVYRPSPVLFLHGFAQGGPENWGSAVGILGEYFSEYYEGSEVGYLNEGSNRYLEVINFGDSVEDRNSSVDTYKVGDHYVEAGKRNPGDPGWADKVADTITNLLAGDKYGSYTDKVNLVCHSMGGLAAREYLRMNGETKVDKLIMTGTPNIGTFWANLALNLHESRLNPSDLWIDIPGLIQSDPDYLDKVDSTLVQYLAIDFDGDAIVDMSLCSPFLGILNATTYPLDAVPPEGIKCYTIYGESPWAILMEPWEDDSDMIVGVKSQRGIISELVSGDTPIYIDSARVFVPKEEISIRAIHGQEPDKIVSPENHLLKIIDFTPPKTTLIKVIENEGQADEIVHDLISNPENPVIVGPNTTITVEGMVEDEYLPASSWVTFEVYKITDGQTGDSELVWAKLTDDVTGDSIFLCPYENQDPGPAGFKEEIEFAEPGSKYIFYVFTYDHSGNIDNFSIGIFYEHPMADATVEAAWFYGTNFGSSSNCHVFYQECYSPILTPYLYRTFIRRPSGTILHIYTFDYWYQGWSWNLEVWGVSEKWSEFTLTWDNRPPLVVKVATFAGSTFSSDGWHTLNIGDSYDMYCLKLSIENSSCFVGGVRFVSREGDVLYRPYWTEE